MEKYLTDQQTVLSDERKNEIRECIERIKYKLYPYSEWSYIKFQKKGRLLNEEKNNIWV